MNCLIGLFHGFLPKLQNGSKAIIDISPSEHYLVLPFRFYQTANGRQYILFANAVALLQKYTFFCYLCRDYA